MDYSQFGGKPPKSAVEIARVLHAIHEAVEPRPPGPFANGLPPQKVRVIRDLAADSLITAPPLVVAGRRLPDGDIRGPLLWRAVAVGGTAGLLLGMQLTAAVTALGFTAAWPLSVPLLIPAATAMGMWYAAKRITGLRSDLFVRYSN